MDSKLTSVGKAVSWRLIATIITGLTVYVITGNFLLSASIVSVDGILKMGAYYFHERAWIKASTYKSNQWRKRQEIMTSPDID